MLKYYKKIYKMSSFYKSLDIYLKRYNNKGNIKSLEVRVDVKKNTY